MKKKCSINYLGYFDPRISFCPYFLQVKLSSGGISGLPILGAATVTVLFFVSSFLQISNGLAVIFAVPAWLYIYFLSNETY